jgi:ssDNA-binding Zn-finger/Zn-ribbon topoisomerase 1
MCNQRDKDDEYLDSLPWWNCECKEAYRSLSQEEAELHPYQCPGCDRVWDGITWFKSTEWYNVVVLYENITTDIDRLVNHGERLDPEFGDWVLDLMCECDRLTHQDVSTLWHWGRSVWYWGSAFKQEHVPAVEAAREACEPLIQLIWRYAESKPWRREEWDDEPRHQISKRIYFKAGGSACPKCKKGRMLVRRTIKSTGQRFLYCSNKECDHSEKVGGPKPPSVNGSNHE